MATISRSSGLRIEVPEGFVLLKEPTTSSVTSREARRHGPRPLPVEAEPPPPLIEALANQEMQTIDSVVLDVTPETAGAVRAALPMERTVGLAVDISAEEGAVVLIEQDGVYSWHLPDEVTGAAVRRTRGPGKREARFSITLGRPASDAKEFKKRGFVSDFIVGRVRAYVLKFVVEWGTKKLMHYLERNVQPGLVNMNSANPAEWSRLGSLDELDALPTDRPARILLFIHGTFSSTLGSYGALGSTSEGRLLLQSAHQRYDAIIGFDHQTLGLAPEENARVLLNALQSNHGCAPPHLDIITFSRGGLVYRALAEILLPNETWRPLIDRVIFVAVPNAGTHLADPDNWHALLDLYTNLAVAAGKVLSRIPQITFATNIFNEMVQGLGALGKYLASQAVTKGDVPGLAAMEPDGPFITEINRVQTGQPTIDTTFYCALTSEFEAQLSGDESFPEEFPKRLAMTVVDQVADRLFGVANDLVVDTPSMTAIDQTTGNFIKDHFSFGKNPRVYHTVYFAQPTVARVLSRWLRLDEPGEKFTRSPSGDWVSPGKIASSVLPPKIDTNVVITTSSETLDTLRNDFEHSPGAVFAIIRRPYKGSILNYAYRRSEVEKLSSGLQGNTTLLYGLRMHEYQASGTSNLASAIEPPKVLVHSPTTRRVVLLDGGHPIGVMPEFDFDAASTQDSGKNEVSIGQALAVTTTTEGILEDEVYASPIMFSSSRRAMAQPPDALTPPVAALKAEDQPPAPVQCHFYAEMQSAVKLGEDASLMVSVSREIIQAAVGMATAVGITQIVIDPARKIILDVRVRENFVVVGNARCEIDPPSPGTPGDIYFSVKPTDLGEGEVWVIARQGQVPLVTLKLRVQIVATQPKIVPPVSARASTDEPVPAAPLCQLRIFERTNGENISYEYDLDIPNVIFDRFESLPMRCDRGEYVKNLYKEIEQRWLSAQQDVEAFTQEMREMGGSLFSQLFPPELQRVLWDNRGAIRRIQVISTEPFIPWEIVHLTEFGQPLPDESLFLAQLGVVRWLHGSYYPSSVKVRNERVRYIIPNYPHPDDKLPGTADEAKYLQQAFNKATPVAPHPIPVRQILRGPGSFDLLHFAGHGMAEPDDIVNSLLQLEGRVENDTEIPEYLSSTAVEQQSRLQSEDGNRPMVVINACQAGRIGFRLTGMGGFAAAFLSRGAGIFVSTLWSVSDQPAKDFIVKLYDELRGGAELADAVIAAREAARVAGDASWLCYTVYGHPNARILIGN